MALTRYQLARRVASYIGAGVIGGGSGKGVALTAAQKNARLFGFRSSNVASLAAKASAVGVTNPGIIMFCETNSGASTWDENVTLVQSYESSHASHTGHFYWAFPLAAGAGQSATAAEKLAAMQAVDAGLFDNQIRAMFESIARLDKGEIIYVAPGWESDVVRWAWSINTSTPVASAALYRSVAKRVMDIGWTVSSRFRYGLVMGLKVTTVDLSFDWRAADCGAEYHSWGGGNPYFLTANGRTQVQDVADKLAGADGLQAVYDYFVGRGGGFAVPENGIDSDSGDWDYAFARWLAGKLVMFYGSWDQSGGSFQCAFTDGSKPAQLISKQREYGVGSDWAAARDGVYSIRNALLPSGKLVAFWNADRDDLMNPGTPGVSSWRDLTLYRNAAQGTAGNQPTEASNWNGTGKSLTTDGTDDYLTGTDVFGTGAINLEFWAVVQNDDTGNTATRGLFSTLGGTFSGQVRLFKDQVANVWKAQFGNGSGTVVASGPAVTNTARTVVRAIITPTGVQVENDGVLGTLVAGAPNIVSGGFTIGSFASAGSPFLGKIKAFIITQPLTTAEANALRTKLIEMRG